jgi:hypothetical protein
MSYSRWSNSYWYTLWVCSDGFEIKEKERFDVCGIHMFSYKELKTDLDQCIIKVVDFCKERCEVQPTQEQINELKGYMRSFIKDVDKHYRKKKEK